ncbi:EboA domain-containing protein [Streptomyces niveus]|uniref:EboA domain-containing protein n=1 Tax=Streptomyces niveus TaxID=193462 RepID=UPI0036D3B282
MNRQPIDGPDGPDGFDGPLDAKAVAWLDQALAEAAESAESAESGSVPDNVAVPRWELRFAAAGRHCGQENADTARTLLLRRAAADIDTLTRLYRRGTAAERRAVLLALPHLVPGPEALPLVEDALRTNDTTIVEAAVGPYAADHLDPHAWRHAVLKCLFTGVPVAAVADAAHRAEGDTELARMLTDFASERTAAGRSVPADLHRVLNMTGEES